MDEVYGDIGVVESVNDNASQDLFEVKKVDKELFIPVNDDIITKVDRENKTIHVKTPEGLVDLYLSWKNKKEAILPPLHLIKLDEILFFPLATTKVETQWYAQVGVFDFGSFS